MHWLLWLTALALLAGTFYTDATGASDLAKIGLPAAALGWGLAGIFWKIEADFSEAERKRQLGEKR